jgi:LysM repeat protein
MQLGALFIFLSFFTIETNAVYESYIHQYKYLAIQEMQRTGIPASIKLSQALLESNAGRSELARKANNHFGIKCGVSWQGDTFYRNDDDFEKGKLIPSCFRKFSHVEESYIAHSEFLMDPKKEKRYGFLFDYSSTEYKKWAKGLKKSGYATNSKYADLLIDIIERYRLYELDKEKHVRQKDTNKQAIAKHEKKTKKPIIDETPATVVVKENSLGNPIQIENDVEFIWVKAGDKVSEIAKKNHIPAKKLYTYNELLAETRGKIQKDERVYLKQKRNNFRGTQRIHRIQPGETMYDISQMYGLKLMSLYKKNRMVDKAQPANGEHIYIRGKRPKGDIVKIRRTTEESQPQEDSTHNSTIPNNSTIILSEKNSQDTLERDQPESIEFSPLYYVVEKGDTLYNISKRFNISAAQLREMNRLEDNVIFVGQKLRVE